jgi:hypothetical protein
MDISNCEKTCADYIKKLLSADFTIAKTLHFPSKTVSLVPRAIFVNCCTFYVQVYYTHWSTGGDNELQYDKQVYYTPAYI